MTLFDLMLWVLPIYVLWKLLGWVWPGQNLNREHMAGNQNEDPSSWEYQLGVFAAFSPRRPSPSRKGQQGSASSESFRSKQQRAFRNRQEEKPKADKPRHTESPLEYQLGIFGQLLKVPFPGLFGSTRAMGENSGARRQSDQKRRQAGGEQEATQQEENQREARRQSEKMRSAERQRQEEQHRWQAEEAERQRRAENQREEARQRERARERQSAHRGTSEPKWWDVLGVSPQATEDEIRRSYASKIKQYHPDRLNGMAPELVQLAETKTKELNGAFTEAKKARR